jgi:hypothetical protein
MVTHHRREVSLDAACCATAREVSYFFCLLSLAAHVGFREQKAGGLAWDNSRQAVGSYRC